MKLFIWINPYDVNYGGSFFHAVASTIEEARNMASSAPAYAHGELNLSENDRGQPYRASVLSKEPTRIIDVGHGYAEWDMWSE